MSTFLELVNDVARESGTMGQQRLATVTGATGRWAKLVAWTRQGWEMIQRERPDWTFLRVEFEGLLIAGTARYNAAAFAISDFGAWGREADGYAPFSIYDQDIGRSDESCLTPLEYRAWARTFDFGDAQEARPTVYSIDFARKLCFGAVPDKTYTLRGSYRRSLQSLAADTDTPFIDAEHHNAIVWRALMLLGDDDEAPFEIASSTAQYRMAHSALIRDYTEAITL